MDAHGSGPRCLGDTGPLISALQSGSAAILRAVLGTIHTTERCVEELAAHGWSGDLQRMPPALEVHRLSEGESGQAAAMAARIAAHPTSRARDPGRHRGEAELLVLACRLEFTGTVVLLDELAARSVAEAMGLPISGFPGVLLLAARQALLTAEQVRERLELCRGQGTRYSPALVERVYQAAMEGEGR